VALSGVEMTRSARAPMARARMASEAKANIFELFGRAFVRTSVEWE